METVIGIDLGTTNCCVAVFSQDKARVITDQLGNNTFPSYMTIKNNDIIVGHKAKAQVISNPYQTIFGVKRLIGRSFESKEVQEAVRHFPFEIKAGPQGDVLVVTEGKEMTPVEASSHLLKAIKESTELHINQPIRKAVITVPAYFNSQQREKTKHAAETAGLEVLRLISEPTAAALAYGFRKELDKRIMVYDLGGGTFDVSLLDVGGNIYEVMATNGDSYLGGMDFDEKLIQYLSDCFEKKHGESLPDDAAIRQRLRDASEKAKCELSFEKVTNILLPSITPKANLELSLTRTKLEELTRTLMDQTFELIDKTLKECELKPTDIDDIILVGGQTRMPAIQKGIQDFFGKPALKGVHPDEAIAVGASIQANLLEASGTTNPEALLVDVTPFSLGIDSYGDTFSTVITKNSTVPCNSARIFTTTKDFQEEVKIVVRQGESSKATDNTLLGEFKLSGIRRAVKLEPQIEVSFRIDSNGILNVTAQDLETKKQQSIVINEFGLEREWDS